MPTALERKQSYWNNYMRKLKRFGSCSSKTRQAHALYEQSVTAYYVEKARENG